MQPGLEHALSALQSDTTQLMLHTLLEAPQQSVLSLKVYVEQGTPPFVASWMIERVRVTCIMSASGARHVAGHELQWLHMDTTQSPGHASSLQVCDSVSIGHAAPPNWGHVLTSRWRYWRPPPQLWEQGDQSPE